MTSFPDWLLLLVLMVFTTGPFLIIFGFWFARRQLGFPRQGRLLAIATWADDVRQHEAEVKTATFGDLILFVTLYVIGVTLFITWYVGKKQTESDIVKADNVRLKEEDQLLEARVQQNEERIAEELRSGTGAPKLISPSADERIIGDHLDFRWQYGNHSNSARYEIQMVRVRDDDAIPVAETSVPAFGESCSFLATNSADQRSRFFAPEGAYVWRVGVGELIGNATTPPSPSSGDPTGESEANGGRPNWFSNCDHDQPNFRIKEWSEYRNFSFYRSRLHRMYATHKVLVGVNTEFGQDKRGPGPFERDLVKAIAGCLLITKDQSNIHLNYAGREVCSESVHAVVGGISTGQIRSVDPSSRSFPLEAKLQRIDGTEWDRALARDDIDLYVGTLTRAAARERDSEGEASLTQGAEAKIRFSDGYFDYKSELLVRPTDDCDIKCLAKHTARVGVLENSTNLRLANFLRQTSRLNGLTVVSFPSPAEMESAFEDGQVRAVLIDNVLRPEMGLQHARHLTDLYSEPGWGLYLKAYIGAQQEQFAIAVGTTLESEMEYSTTRPSSSIDTSLIHRIPSPAGERDRDFLVNQINLVLRSEELRGLMESSYQRYDVVGYGATLSLSTLPR